MYNNFDRKFSQESIALFRIDLRAFSRAVDPNVHTFGHILPMEWRSGPGLLATPHFFGFYADVLDMSAEPYSFGSSYKE